ncbi:MAG: M48 family metallopeptidase [Patescibacteria group bacterium]
MPSLYTHQDSNIRRTYFLFAGFLIVVIGLGWSFSYIFNNQGILFFAVSFSIVSAIVSYFSSDKIALALARARQIEKKDNPYLWNMIENLSITAGLPMPRLYVTSDKQINAFATGRDPEHAAIAVTEGAIARLENEELEGVLAHELSHVGNRDILVSTVAVILAGVVSLLGDFFMRSMFWGGMRRNNNNNRAGGLMVLIGIALSILAPIAALLIQLAISRRREFLADASGALLTRYPEGLAKALEKIGKDAVPMPTARDSTAHLWIDTPFKGKGVSWLHKLFMTHPPVEERVAALRGLK